MCNKAKKDFGGRRRFLAFSLAVLAALGLMQTGMVPAFQASPAMEGKKLSPEAEKKIEIARDQHSLIMLLIKKQEFDSIEAEWQTILDLRLGDEFESLIGASIVNISHNLILAKQFTLAQKLMDKSLAVVPFSNKSKADIYSCMVDLYTGLGDISSAIKMLRKVQALEGKP
jgi:hypothetical protein